MTYHDRIMLELVEDYVHHMVTDKINSILDKTLHDLGYAKVIRLTILTTDGTTIPCTVSVKHLAEWAMHTEEK